MKSRSHLSPNEIRVGPHLVAVPRWRTGTFGFICGGLSGVDDNGCSVDFGDLEFNGGLNRPADIERSYGVFIELKSAVYAEPHFRVLVGVAF